MDSYKTIKVESCEKFVEKHSKFICAAKPVKTEEEALDFIKIKKEKYFNATHNVYAYIIRDQNIMRYSDDGEPQGTAGIPVLNVIKKNSIFDAVVVITRYFGGILLGSGGLVRAYSHSANMALETGKIILMRKCVLLSINCDYSEYAKIYSLISSYESKIIDNYFLDKITIIFYILEDNIDRFNVNLSEITSGKINAEIIKETYFEI